jgi:hypothetical protein
MPLNFSQASAREWLLNQGHTANPLVSGKCDGDFIERIFDVTCGIMDLLSPYILKIWHDDGMEILAFILVG